MKSFLLRKVGALVCAAVCISAATVAADSNIDPAFTGNKFGWAENGGWMNLQGDFTNGVHVGPTILSGFAWHENFGWINFGDGLPPGPQYSNTSATDFGVNMDLNGDLFGFAWGENIGWINFDTVTAGGSNVNIDQSTGVFSGFAWGENVGWIAFDTVNPADVAKTVGNTKALNWTLY